ncbi:MAG: ATP-binding protein [Xanthomonadaceae bacterium]|nr:ATP-binding protein [Xanthomonadaceae bacterium]
MREIPPTTNAAASASIAPTQGVSIMARSDLLVNLVSAASAGDQAKVRSMAEALAADERAKNHHLLAERLQRAATNVTVSSSSLRSVAERAHGQSREAIIELQAQLRFDQLLLPLPVSESGRQLVEEHARADVLRSHGYEPRHRVLLSGPPGNGKTSFAEAVAEALALPFFVVRYDALIGSYLGETNSRLRGLFDYVRSRPCVLFFDEFDAIGKERGDSHETGEIKRVVSFLLMQLDQLPSYVIVLVATNHAELLDRAVWRRFQMRLSLPMPDRRGVEAMLTRCIARWPNRPKRSVARLAASLGPVSYSEAVDFCQNIRRRQILSLGELGIDQAIGKELELWTTRVRPEALNDGRPEQAAAARRARAARQTKKREKESKASTT